MFYCIYRLFTLSHIAIQFTMADFLLIPASAAIGLALGTDLQAELACSLLVLGGFCLFVGIIMAPFYASKLDYSRTASERSPRLF